MPAFAPPRCQNEALRFLEMDADDLRKLTPAEAAVGAGVVTRYAAYLSRACQREEARARWAREQGTRLVAADGLLDQVRGYSFEERRVKAVGLRPEAQEMETLRLEAEARAARLQYAAKWAGDVARTLESQSNTYKRSREVG